MPGKQVNALAPRGIPESAAKLRFVPGYMKRAPKAKNDNKNNNNDNNEDVNIEITDITADIEVGGEEIQFEENVVQIMIKNSDNNKKKNDKRKKDVKNKNSKEVSDPRPKHGEAQTKACHYRMWSSRSSK